MSCADEEAVRPTRASPEVLDASQLFRHPTAPHLAAFILPSRGRVAFSLRPHDQMDDTVRYSATEGQSRDHHSQSDDRGTKRLSPGVMSVAGEWDGAPMECDCSAA